MNLPRWSIHNHHFTLMFFTLLTIMGIQAFFTMPRTEDPPIQIPGATVVVVYPGADPADMEELIVDPVEEAINQLEDIKRIETVVKDGVVSISVEFTFGTNANDKFNEVVQQVNSIRGNLPSDIYGISFSKWSSSDVNILQLAFVSDKADYPEMELSAKDLKKQIEKLPGVRTVELYALPEREIRVSMNMEKMALMNLSMEQIAGVIMSSNLNIPGGNLTAGNRNFSIKTSGSYRSVEEIKNTAVASNAGKVVYLKDVADVSFRPEDRRYFARFGKEKAIFLTVQQKENLNIFSVMKDVNAVISRFSADMDPDIKLDRVFDQSDSVKSRVDSFLESLYEGLLLVGLLIFLVLGFRASLLVVIALPLSIIIGLGFVALCGFGLQQISIAALVVALGMLVDDSIVISENIERFIRNGYTPREAAAEATEQLFWPVVTTTLTTVCAFIPIALLPDKTGKFIQSLPVTVSFTLMSSMLIALVLTPYLASIFLSREMEMKAHQTFLKRKIRNFIEGPYRRTLHLALQHKVKTLAIAVTAFVLALVLFFSLGVSFFPKAEKNQFMIRVLAPEGTAIDQTDRIARRVESVLDTIPLVQHYATNVGHGNPRIYYNFLPRYYSSNFAEIFVELKRFEPDEFDRLVEHLRSIFSREPGADILIKVLEQGTPIEAPFVVKIMGKDLDVLKDIAGKTEARLRQVNGLLNIDNQLAKTSTDLYFRINKDKAAQLGVLVSDINKTIRACVAGFAVSKMRDENGKEYNIVLRMPQGEHIKPGDFRKVYVKSLSGHMVPLLQLASVEFKPSPGMLTHYNLTRNASITADLDQGVFVDDVIAQMRPFLDHYPWPRGYSYMFAGEYESRNESFGGVGKAALITLLLIFAIMVLEFRSLKQPLIIFTTMPLAMIGAGVALFVSGTSFSFTAFIGLVSLIGIVVKNAIIFVDYANILLRQGKELVPAIKEAGETRFTPILLTSMCTVGGLIPLIVRGGTLWKPMGLTLAAGLFVSTFLTLIVVPVLFSYLHKKP